MHAKLTQWHQQDEHRAFAQLDISNAFGSLAREHLPALLADIAPDGYLAWGEWLEHHLFSQLDVLVPGHADGGPDMQRRELRQGLPQGDPLSAVVFGACLARILQKFLTMHPSIEAVCYVDDIIIGGRAAALAQALQDLPAFLQHWGLKMATAKTRLWSPSPDMLQKLRIHDVHLEPSEGLLICGHTLTAEGLRNAIRSARLHRVWLAQKASQESRLLQRLLRYGDALSDVPTWHFVYQLLQCFWPARLMHLMRSLPYDHFSGTLEQIQDHVNEAYLYVMQVDRMSPLQWKVTHLPTAHGGLGVPDLASLSLCARSAALAALPTRKRALW